MDWEDEGSKEMPITNTNLVSHLILYQLTFPSCAEKTKDSIEVDGWVGGGDLDGEERGEGRRCMGGFGSGDPLGLKY